MADVHAVHYSGSHLPQGAAVPEEFEAEWAAATEAAEVLVQRLQQAGVALDVDGGVLAMPPRSVGNVVLRFHQPGALPHPLDERNWRELTLTNYSMPKARDANTPS